ncbi:hypothetical protein GCM10022223_51690 [Kineosporia mesophila]|uniref:Uncharacterized protein n=1 Tax=Kineosporia mesophila TaxID=566012 RepID=A0ABP7AA28_9ACTN|nr:hypothetical protein [Kineosporia mesophila]MCD5351440.1 hypothetical protein [Kineosporia mesophila]
MTTTQAVPGPAPEVARTVAAIHAARRRALGRTAELDIALVIGVAAALGTGPVAISPGDVMCSTPCGEQIAFRGPSGGFGISRWSG